MLRWGDAAIDRGLQVSVIRQAVDAARSDFSMAELATPGNELTTGDRRVSSS
jgi:hypothetical protein